jgi:serine/threonine protein kinase
MNEFELFQSALDIEDPSARSRFLKSACAQDAAMLCRVEALLSSHHGQSQFLIAPVVQQIADAASVVPQLVGEGSTNDDGADATALLPSGSASNVKPQDEGDDEIPLGYLEPSTTPGSLGRLAHYDIREVIGRGAFGTVLRAFDDKLQRVVAIKVMAVQLAATSPARKRFMREAQASAAIRHENVVSVYAVEEKPLPYLVMEYIPGLTLQQYLQERGPLDLPTVLRLGRQIAEGLAAAHSQDLIHRDIKPGNILLETSVHDRVKITDFGLARAADDASLTQSGMIAGTPMYMAPEQALGHKLDQRADLFSLGSVLYQMISGRPPFRASSTLAALKRVTEDTPRPIREIIPETPQWLCDIITKLHAKNPDDRYQSAREVADVLANCESQLKSYSGFKDFSLIPRTKQQPVVMWKWVAVAAIAFPLLAFGLIAYNRPTAPSTRMENGTVQPTATDSIELDPGLTSPQLATSGVMESDGWVQLFNGKDLTGWTFLPSHTGVWEVKDGILRGSARQSHLLSQRGDFGNFHLRAEVKINLGGDSGILFRAPFQVLQVPPPTEYAISICYETEIQKNRNYLRRTGSISQTADGAPPANLGLVIDDSYTEPDEWFNLELIATDNHFITKINGQEAANCIDPFYKHSTGHFALQVWNPNTLVQFRKIEIKELPPSSPLIDVPVARQFASDEWIDVIPLVDPRMDKWHILRQTGNNAWRMEQGELVIDGDLLGSKLLLPLDSAWPAFECEIEFTRRAGSSGLNVNLPSRLGYFPVVIDPPGYGGGMSLGVRDKGVLLSTEPQIVTGRRSSLRIEVRRQAESDRIEVAMNGAKIGEWSGDRNTISGTSNEGFPADRRFNLWTHGGGNTFVFHRIRIRMLDGGTAESLRPVPSNPPIPTAKPKPLEESDEDGRG